MDRRTLMISAAAAGLAPLGARAEDRLELRSLYNEDLSYSDAALALDGQKVVVDGFMAPPLRAETNFFVLTKIPMSVCPLCQTEAEWPDDILAVYARRHIRLVPYNWPIVAEGRLELGTHVDREFGFLSRVRLIDARYKRA